MACQTFRSLSSPGWVLALLLLVGGCGADLMPLENRPEKRGLKAVSFDSLPGWNKDKVSQAAAALESSCRYMLKKSDGRSVGAALGNIGHWRPACETLFHLDKNDEAAFRRFLMERFTPFQVTGNDNPQGMFTGYYEPMLRGSPVKSGKYTTPLYRKPKDLITVDLGDAGEKAGSGQKLQGRIVNGRFVAGNGGGRLVSIDLSEYRDRRNPRKVSGRLVNNKLVPYFDRNAIAKGSLAGRGLELVWVDDAIDAFFLEIQGSGRVKMTDGRTIQVGYHGQNGHQYYAIGRDLIRRNIIDRDDMSLQTLEAWLRRNPRDGHQLMMKNRSYVFFRHLPGKNQGPPGAQEVPLTPGRSLAVDRRYVALGAPIWLDTTDPVTNQPIQRLVVAQDTGGAIKGAVRGDLFWGHGDMAEQRAGRMRQDGRYWILLPKGLNPAN